MSSPITTYIPQSSKRTLDAPDLVGDFYLDLLDWGSNNNVLVIALGEIVYLWDALDSSTSKLVTFSCEKGHVTSFSWAPYGRHLAISLNNSDVYRYDITLLIDSFSVNVYGFCFMRINFEEFTDLCNAIALRFQKEEVPSCFEYFHCYMDLVFLKI